MFYDVLMEKKAAKGMIGNRLDRLRAMLATRGKTPFAGGMASSVKSKLPMSNPPGLRAGLRGGPNPAKFRSTEKRRAELRAMLPTSSQTPFGGGMASSAKSKLPMSNPPGRRASRFTSPREIRRAELRTMLPTGGNPLGQAVEAYKNMDKIRL